jgi:hypothetical protein
MTLNLNIEDKTVTIHTLKVGTKQVTQTVFWQLPIKEVLDKQSGNLLGNVWGYIIIADRHNNQTKHVLWEVDGILYRCTLEQLNSIHTSVLNTLFEAIEQEATYYVMALALNGKRWSNTKTKSSEEVYHISMNITEECEVTGIPITKDVRTIWTYNEYLEKLQTEIQQLKQSKIDRPINESYYQQQITSKQTDITKLDDSLKTAKQSIKLDILKWLDIEHIDFSQVTNESLVEDVKQKLLNSKLESLAIYKTAWDSNILTIENSNQLFIGV